MTNTKIRLVIGFILPFVLLVITMLIASCQPPAANNSQPATPTSYPTAIIITQIVTATPGLSSLPTVACAPLPPGMSISIVPVSHTAAKVDLKGFQPGESITLIFTTSDGNNSNRIVSGPVAIQPDGTFSTYEGLTITPDRTDIHWQAQILYDHSAACTKIDMPQ